MKKTIFLLSGVLLSLHGFSQNFIGSQLDGRAGVHSTTLNPALGALSRTKLDISLVSASSFVGNDYLSINLSDLGSLTEGFDADEDMVTYPKTNNNFFGNVDVLGPSMLLRLNGVSAFSLTTRVRGFLNLNNIDGTFYEMISDDGFGETDFNTQMEDLSGVGHVWGEIGLGYSRVVAETASHSFTAGANVKVLLGAGGVFGSAPILGASYQESSDLVTMQGTLDYGYSEGFEGEEMSFSSLKPGVAVDLGFVYELKGNSAYQPYKLRAGVSVLDIGSLSYEEGYRMRYDMDATIEASEFEEKDIEEVLEDNFTGTEIPFAAKMKLPTSLQIFADYSVTGRFYVSAQAGLALGKAGEIPVSRVINTASVTPRLEMKWLSVYSPISWRQYDSTPSWGLGLRMGPVMVGSGSLLTNLLSENSKSADVYAAIKLPIYGRNGR